MWVSRKNPRIDIIKRHKFTYIELLSFIGGVASGLRMILIVLSSVNNVTIVETKLINFLYFRETPDFLKEDFPSFTAKTYWSFHKFSKFAIPGAT